MRILLTGSTGQVGHELASLLSAYEVVSPSHAECDLSNAESIRNAVRDARADLIINPGAYTAVDRAEQEPVLARAVNAIAPDILAEEARKRSIPLIHFSTDYVFDGAATAPYEESHPVAPISVYGATKLEGERAIEASGCAYIILRTAWVYGRHGKNFLMTIERLARERPRLTIVADQRGTPNWGRALARATTSIALRDRDELSERRGIYHLSGQGETTWHGFATAIVESMRDSEQLDRPVEVAPITTAEYRTPAKRPAYSVLSTKKLERSFGITLPPWRTSLDECQSANAR